MRYSKASGPARSRVVAAPVEITLLHQDLQDLFGHAHTLIGIPVLGRRDVDGHAEAVGDDWQADLGSAVGRTSRNGTSDARMSRSVR